jgi:poly-gamma-glutamate synthesis protein (capsule biosynthesis protein)
MSSAAATSRTLALLLAVALLGCAAAPVVTTATSTPPGGPSTTVGPATSTVPSTTPTAPSTTTTTVPTTTTTPPAFTATAGVADPSVLSHSWHEGCPVHHDQLRRVVMTHWGFDGMVHEGAIVVHADQVESVSAVFAILFEAGYPIQSMIPIGELPEGAEDLPGYSNTSGLHCRFVEGTTRWSQHAFGRAVDLNPHLNPLVDGAYVWPTDAGRYADRGLGEPGMILPGDVVVEAFSSVGWGWGGDFRSFKDWHHFSATGN